jgi:ATP-binding cassette subfamily B protein RaxB
LNENRIASIDLGFLRKKSLSTIFQSESAECGLACIAMIANFHGYQVKLTYLRQLFEVGQGGATLKAIAEIAQELNFSTRLIKVDLEDLPFLKTPCILHWNLDHFVALEKVTRSNDGEIRSVTIHDPAEGKKSLSISEVSKCFTGIALELEPTSYFSKKKIGSFDLASMLYSLNGAGGIALKILAVALSLEIFSLASPFYLQLIVDSAIVSGDYDQVYVLAIGFFLILLCRVLLEAFRSWSITILNAQVSEQWPANVFRHLLALPTSYFEKRSFGDVVSKFSSVYEIQRTLSATFVESLIDGLLAVTAFVMLFIYSALLAGIVFVSAVLYVILRSAIHPRLRRHNDEQINQQAKERAIFFESIRAIQAIKSFGAENKRLEAWRNSLVMSLNKMILASRIRISYESSQSLISGVENILIIAWAAKMAISNEFSIGMIYAFLAYKATFASRFYSLVNHIFDIKLLSVQVERLDDIVSSEKEVGENAAFKGKISPFLCNDAELPLIEMRNVSFRYADTEPWVIRNLDLRIYKGESVAITGASGGGKTTILKLLTGSLTPTLGEILINGTSFEKINIQAYRKEIAIVQQDDQLLSGTIAENISFFDDEATLASIERCAWLASVSNDVMMFPMGYATVIGDMGSMLSGGQKQRILLARALYRNPKILFLDEATSHLDVPKEKQVSNSIRNLALTKIFIAHRMETIQTAGRIVELVCGTVHSDRINESL